MKFSFLRNQAANIITLSNMTLGLFAILSSIQSDFKLSCLLIFIAAITDFTDGWVARKLKTVSKLGKYLDSNSDLISFGVAPGLLIYLSVLQQYGIYGAIVSFIFIMCGGIRLARYNAIDFTGRYIGIPITISGTLLALSSLAIPHIPNIIFVFTTLILSYLMVSKISIKKI